MFTLMSGNPVHVGDEDDDDDDQLRREIKRIKQNSVAPKTLGVYYNYLIKFIQWLIRRTSPAILMDALKDAILPATNVAQGKAIRGGLEKAPEHRFVDFSYITDDLIALWVVSLRKRNKDQPGVSVLNSARSAVNHLFKMYNEPMPTDTREKLGTLFRGLKRTAAQNEGSGKVRTELGKIPMEFSLYQFLSWRLLISTNTESLFVRLYLLLSWNLMCRAGNTCSIAFSHMAWVDDALTILFAHMKNDQEGSRKSYPRHIYANPLQMELCPILALGMYLLVDGFDKAKIKLFPGIVPHGLVCLTDMNSQDHISMSGTIRPYNDSLQNPLLHKSYRIGELIRRTLAHTQRERV